MPNPTSERGFRAWWQRSELPMLRGDYPDMSEEELDGWWMLKVDALVDDKRLPRKAKAWGRRHGGTRCACGHTRDEHCGRTGGGQCVDCDNCYKFKTASE